MILDFDFEQLFGDEQYKFVMNMFLTDKLEFSSFSANDGNFFFVFDKKDTWVPNYPFTLPDLNIGGKPFVWLYKIEDEYERSRVIIKDNEKLLKGTLDIKQMFNLFIENDIINSDQYIYQLQLGIEVTEGYGAVRINEATMNKE